jgi:hypothetical protein
MPFKNIKKEIEETKRELKKQTITLILGGFGVVAALAWNEAIKSFFETFLPKENALIGKFFYAILVTIIVAILSSRLTKISKGEE